MDRSGEIATSTGRSVYFQRLGLYALGIAGLTVLALAGLTSGAPKAQAATPPACAGAVMMGGAQLMCSLPNGKKSEVCNYSWALMTMDSQTRVISGTFVLPPGANNMQIYQGSGFANALSMPIVLCQDKRDND